MIDFKHEYGDEARKVLGLKVTPHAAAQEIYYRIGVRFLSIPTSGIINDEFRRLIEWLKTSACDFLILFTYPEFVEYKRLESYMREEVKWAPANKRIFIKNLNESDLAMILTDPAGFSTTFEGLILDAIRDFNEGMLGEYLLTPLYGLKWAHRRLNPNDEANIYSKLGDKWFQQVYEAIEDTTIREFIKENYRAPPDGQIEFGDGEVIRELFDSDMNMIISEYERKVYRLIENCYRIEKTALENELDRAFVSGALYKLTQARLSCYQFIVEILLLATRNLVKIYPEFDSSGRQKTVIITRKVSEEKQSALNMIEDIEKTLFREVSIPFDGDTYLFSNKKYISSTLDKLKILDEYIAALSEPDDLLERAIILTQLFYIMRSLEKLRTQPADGFTEIIQGIQQYIENAKRAEAKVTNELIKQSAAFTPATFATVKGQIRGFLSKISGYIKDGRLFELIRREVDKLEGLVKNFDVECDQITVMLMTIEDEIRENNEKCKNIMEKKQASFRTLNKIPQYKLDEYAESTLASVEKSTFETLLTFLKNVDSLHKPREIDHGEAETLLKALEKTEFSKVLERYQRNVKSVRERTLEIDGQYNSLSSDFISKSETLVSALTNFWSQRVADIEDKVYALKIVIDGVSRVEELIDFYHDTINTVGVSGTKIAHAIACGFLDSFLFLDRTRTYADKLGMSMKEFSNGLISLKKAGVLKEGVG